MTLWSHLLLDCQDERYIQLFRHFESHCDKRCTTVPDNTTSRRTQIRRSLYLFTFPVVVVPIVTNPQLLHKLSTESA
jgi:hypothetical protein